MILTSLLATNCFAVLVLKLIIIFKSSTMTHNSWVLWIVHLIFEINVGEGRIRHRTTPKFNFLIDSKWIEDGVIWIWSSSISDPTVTDIDFKNKLAWVWTTLKIWIEVPFAWWHLTRNIWLSFWTWIWLNWNRLDFLSFCFLDQFLNLCFLSLIVSGPVQINFILLAIQNQVHADLRVFRPKPFNFRNQCRKEADPT